MTIDFDRRAPMRICFFGDSFVNGTGDDSCLGWVGRACAAGRRNGHDLTGYNLGVRRDTSGDIRSRWRREAEARLPPEYDGRLVFSFGANDGCLREDASSVRVTHAEAMANAQAILASAASWRPTLMVGPLPVCDESVDRRTAELSMAFGSLCAGLGVPYLEAFHLAARSEIWAREVMAGDGAHPNERGYAIVAEAFMQWEAWRAWAGDAATADA
jgi:acyl-CoA thioesterase-1